MSIYHMENFPKSDSNENTVQWQNPDGTIGSGTEADRKEALENWDSK